MLGETREEGDTQDLVIVLVDPETETESDDLQSTDIPSRVIC